ncbi:LLM class flavin-dependent oxidoreductase [Pseudonocardia ailaonensis]|uniref:LLM class flavin-dependent oxidoreductase n=1 Tax=Pseudonocardia ailaonensis TaxID=367279 RepID=A0ABN2N8P8_9PSEU
MRFGINLFPTVGPADKPADRYFADALRLAELAERSGLDHVKTVEHHATPYGGYSPDPVTLLAAVAARTSRIRLVTGAVIPAFTHPVALAGRLAMLDNISGGRLSVGFARAFLPDEFAAFGIPLDESRARFDESVAAIERLWTDEDVRHEGRFHTFGPLTVLPRPLQRPHPPVLVASARSPESCVAAGRAGRGLLLVPSINSVERVQEVLALYREEWRRAGHPGEGEVQLSYSCYLADDDAEALEQGRRYAERTNAVLADAVEPWVHTRSDQYPGYEGVVEKARNADFGRQLASHRVLVGDPARVLDTVHQIREWFGEVTVSAQVISGNPPLAESERTVTLLAEQVAPHVTSQTIHI